MNETKITALYERLSVDDDRSGESNSIKNQKLQLEEYAKVPVGVRCKTQHCVNAEVVLALISDMLRAIADYSKNDRAEDMANDVFIPVGKLPKPEPKVVRSGKRNIPVEGILKDVYNDESERLLIITILF